MVFPVLLRGPRVQLLLCLPRPGHPHPASPRRVGAMRSLRTAHSAPCRPLAGAAGGLGRAGPSVRPSWASPWPGPGGPPGLERGRLGKSEHRAGLPRAWPSWTPAATGQPCEEPVEPGGALCSAAVPTRPAWPSWGVTLYTGREGAWSVRVSAREEAVGRGCWSGVGWWGCRAPLNPQARTGPLPPSFPKPPL